MNNDLEKQSVDALEEQTISEQVISEETPQEESQTEEKSQSEQTEKKEKFFDKKFAIFTSVLVVLMAVIIAISNYVTFMVVVSGSSMKPTFQGGEVFFVNKLAEPEKGDIVIVKVMEKAYADDDTYLTEVWIIKRLIAMPGDKVEIKNGYVFVNDILLEEDYVSSQGITYALDWETKVLGEDEYFYLGDNRGIGQSSDSRDGEKGACSREDILGVVTDFSIRMKGVSKFLYNFTAPIRKVINHVRG